MVTTQIQLTEEQETRLKARAASEGVSVADLIRRGVDLCLQAPVSREEQKRRALAVIGRFNSGCGDLAERHDAYLPGVYR